MTNPDFIDLIKNMRSAQVEYFKTRTTDALKKSKKLERMVDREIKELETNQPKIF